MKIRLFMNDYLDIYISENGVVRVEMGKIDDNGIAQYDISYVNSSFSTFMKYMGIDVTDLGNDVSKYISDNELFIRIKRNADNTGLKFGLHDIHDKSELVSYNSFDELVEVEVLQKENNLN